MKRSRVIIIIVVALLLGAGGFAWYVTANPDAWAAIRASVSAEVEPALAELGLATVTEQGVTASGFIEAEEVVVASEVGGRVVALYADKGDDVQAGTPLVRLDDALVAAQIRVAEAGLETARAQLAQAEAGARPEQVRQAEAGLAQAEARRDGAYQAWQDALALRDHPPTLDAQIAQARTRVAVAEAAVEQAQALKDVAEIALDGFDEAQEAVADARDAWAALPEDQRPPKPYLPVQLDFHLIPNHYWKAWVQLNTAQAELDAAQVALYDLLDIRDNPQELAAQADAAEAAYRTAQAAVGQAEAQLALVEAGAGDATLAVLAAQVEQAEARLTTLQRERAKAEIAAPVGGVVLRRDRHAGELTAPGGPIMTLGALDEVKLTIYVPSTQVGRVRVGQTAEVHADGLDGGLRTGTVVAIASDAEFTPRNVQSKEERVYMVFAVEIVLPNPDHVLKPGVHADATVITEGE